MSSTPTPLPTDRSPQVGRTVVAAQVALVLLKMWLVSGQGITAIGPSLHDSHLSLYLAKLLIHGKWLGAYNQMTLAKGPFYPMWVAAMFELGVPLLFSQHLLYAGACIAFSSAVAPAIGSPALRLALFAALLFNPLSFADGPMNSVLRDGVYPSLSLLVLGCALALALRLDRPPRSNRRWVVGLGCSLAAFWLCREERVWIVPALLLVAGVAVARSPSCWRGALRMGVGALTLFALLVGGVALKNWSQYGVFAINEFTGGSFPEAYAALGRVGATSRLRPIPAESRRLIYAVSPRFAELRPFLEGDLGRSWTNHGCSLLGVCDDIAAGWLMWALRDAAGLAGHYRSAGEASRFWAEVAREVDAACGDGRLPCHEAGHGFMPRLQREDVVHLAHALAHGAAYTATFEGVTARPSPSVGPDEALRDFRDLARTRLTPAPDVPEKPVPEQEARAARLQWVLEHIIVGYRWLTPPLAIASLLAFAGAIVSALLRRRVTPLLLVAAAFLVASATRIAVLALVQATTFPALHFGYLAPAYPLLAGFVVLAIPAAIEAVRARPAERVSGEPRGAGDALREHG